MSQVHKPFTPEEDAHLLYLRKLGRTIGQMGAALNRRDTTCWNRLRKLLGEHKKPAPKKVGTLPKRRCLGLECRQWFQPEYEGQYLHEKCKVKDYSPYEVASNTMGAATRTGIAA